RPRYAAMTRLRSSSRNSLKRPPNSIGSFGLRRFCGFREEGTATVLGCLTSKSEERETWTAESLRTPSSLETLVFGGVRSDENSAVDVLGQHQLSCAFARTNDWWDLVNVAAHGSRSERVAICGRRHAQTS